ncbi:hypothetical protein ILUMI_08244 [Ignelater luminosus]|uniref:RNA-directed DNA polymerase n=1 Tax=Ignelater luminosus TaxID=2038154 RepID=A0A8K0GFK8_IGNLU|nr:hypothetical protein ILUMI_08244 [Ignelater luminosus]
MMESNNKSVGQASQSIHPFNPTEHMDGVPLFCGANLFRFINASELVIQNFTDRRLNFQTGQNARILNSIKKRISDECYKRLTIYPLDTWEQLRYALLDCFGDSRSEEQLLLEIMNFKQNHLQLDDYYSKFIELAQLLVLKADQAQQNFYNNLLLKRFIGNMYAPLSAAVKSLNPQNMPQAYQKAREYVQEHPEYYSFPKQKTLNKLPQRRHPSLNPFISQFPQDHQLHRNQFQHNQFRVPQQDFNQSNQFPSQPIPIQSKQIPQKFPTNKQVFGKPSIAFGPDASKYALGAVLSQGTIGQDKPIEFASRTLNNSELNYSTIEKECLAVVWAVNHFRPYVFGRKFNIITDHKPLLWLFNLKKPNSKLVRWRLKLEEYTYNILHKKGKLNKNADGLSRMFTSESINTIETHNPQINQDSIRSLNVNATNDSDSLICQTEHEESNSIQTQHTQKENIGSNLAISENPINKFSKQNILISMPLNENEFCKIIKQEVPHRNCLRKTFALNNSNLLHSIYEFLKNFCKLNQPVRIYSKIDKISEKLSLAIQQFPNLNVTLYTQLLDDISQENDQYDLIKIYHEGKTNHRGIDVTYKTLSAKYYFPKMHEMINRYINNCETCQKSKYERHPPNLLISLTDTPTKPFEIIHMDILTLNRFDFLTLIDKFSKFLIMYPLTDKNMTSILDELTKFIAQYTLPNLIVADNQFNNTLFKEFIQNYYIKAHFTTAYSSTGNSPIERVHSTIHEHNRLLRERYKNYSILKYYPLIVLAYNDTLHSTTNQKPRNLLFGHFSDIDSFDRNPEHELMQSYIKNHREVINTLYKQVYEKQLNQKSKIIDKLNKNKQNPDIPKPGQAFQKIKHNQPKNQPKFKPISIVPGPYNSSPVVITSGHKKVHQRDLKLRKFLNDAN